MTLSSIDMDTHMRIMERKYHDLEDSALMDSMINYVKHIPSSECTQKGRKAPLNHPDQKPLQARSSKLTRANSDDQLASHMPQCFRSGHKPSSQNQSLASSSAHEPSRYVQKQCRRGRRSSLMTTSSCDNLEELKQALPPSNPLAGSVRRRIMRRQSVMATSSMNDDAATIVTETSSVDGSFHTDRDFPGEESYYPQATAHITPRSILKTKDSSEPVKTGSNSDKFVRFATKNKKIVRLVKKFFKTDRHFNNELWWSDEELDVRNDRDEEMVSILGDDYGKAIAEAFRSSKENIKTGNEVDSIDLSFDSMVTFSALRGLETICFNDTQKYRDSHVQEILRLQEVIYKAKPKKKSKGRIRWADSEMELIRMKSLKSSRAWQSVAHGFAKYDAVLAQMQSRNKADTDTIYR